MSLPPMAGTRDESFPSSSSTVMSPGRHVETQRSATVLAGSRPAASARNEQRGSSGGTSSSEESKISASLDIVLEAYQLQRPWYLSGIGVHESRNGLGSVAIAPCESSWSAPVRDKENAKGIRAGTSIIKVHPNRRSRSAKTASLLKR